MTIRHQRLLAVLLALAGAATVEGCGTILPAGDGKLCELGFLPTQPVVTGPSMLGTMWAKCAPDRPDSHQLSLEWKRRGADWSVSASEIGDKIPGTTRTSYQVKAPCVAGIWRIKARVSATFQGKHYDVTETSQERLVGADACTPG